MKCGNLNYIQVLDQVLMDSQHLKHLQVPPSTRGQTKNLGDGQKLNGTSGYQEFLIIDKGST